MGDTPYARLAAFRASHESDAVIDEASGLTAADLDVILDDRKRLAAEDVAAELGDLA